MLPSALPRFRTEGTDSMSEVRQLRSPAQTHPLQELTSRIIACCIEVHRTLGPGFEEVFYQRALLRELDAAGLEAAREVDIEVSYKGLALGKKRVDFVVGECMLEIKARSALEDVDRVQALSYLKASGFAVGLLVNFGGPKVQVVRLANTQGRGTTAETRM